MPRLDRITVYPVKSLDGLDVAQAEVLSGGALRDDRRFALVDADGWAVHGKRTAAVHRVRSTYDRAERALTLGLEGGSDRRTFQMDADRDALQAWLSEALGVAVQVVEDQEAGFPDDTEAPGPTVVAAATLDAVAAWFPGLDGESCRRRFRANLTVGGVDPFWDDRLYEGPGRAVRFRVGGVVFEGTNPCQRCVVPGRSPTTGEAVPAFPARFASRRREALPPWAEAARFDHFFRLAVNTRLADRGAGVVRVGDPVEILGPVPR